MVEKTGMRVTVIGKSGKVEKVVQSTVGGSSKQNETAEGGKSGGNFGRTTIYSSKGTDKTAQQTQEESKQAIQEYEEKQQEAKRLYDQVAKIRASGKDVRPVYEEASRRGYNISEQVGSDIHFYKGSSQASKGRPQLIAQVEGERVNTTKGFKKITNAGEEKERALQEAVKTGVGIIEDRGFPIQRKTINQTERDIVNLPFGAIGSKEGGGYMYDKNAIDKNKLISTQESPTGIGIMRDGKVVPIDVVEKTLATGGGTPRNNKYFAFEEYKGEQENIQKERLFQEKDKVLNSKLFNAGIDFLEQKGENIIKKTEKTAKVLYGTKTNDHGFRYLGSALGFTTEIVGGGIGDLLKLPSNLEQIGVKVKKDEKLTKEDWFDLVFTTATVLTPEIKAGGRIVKSVGRIGIEKFGLEKIASSKVGKWLYKTEFAVAEETAIKQLEKQTIGKRIVTGTAKTLVKYPLELGLLGYGVYEVSKAEDKREAIIGIGKSIVEFEILGKLRGTSSPLNKVTKFELKTTKITKIDDLNVFKDTPKGRVTSGRLVANKVDVFENLLGERIVTRQQVAGKYKSLGEKTDVEISLKANVDLYPIKKSKGVYQSEQIGRVSSELNTKEISTGNKYVDDLMGEKFINEIESVGYSRGGIKYSKAKQVDLFEIFSQQNVRGRETSLIKIDDMIKLNENLFGRRKTITARDITGREVLLTKRKVIPKDSLNAFDIQLRNKAQLEPSLLDRTRTNKIDNLFISDKLITGRNKYLYFGKSETITNTRKNVGFSKSSIREFEGELTGIEQYNIKRGKKKETRKRIDDIKKKLSLNKKGQLMLSDDIMSNRPSTGETGFEILTKESIKPRLELKQEVKLEVVERIKKQSNARDLIAKQEIKNAFNLFDRPSLPRTRNRYMGISRERVGVGENTKIKGQLDNLLKTGLNTKLDTGALTKLETGALTKLDTGLSTIQRTTTKTRTRSEINRPETRIDTGVGIPFIPSLSLGMGYTPKYGKGSVSRRKGKRTYIADYTSATLGFSKKATGRELDKVYSGLEIRRVLR